MNKIKEVKYRSLIIGLMTCIFSTTMLPSYSQTSANANLWYFGLSLGLNFSTSPPTVLSGGNTFGAGYNVESSASITDSLGNLLFLASGPTLYNGNLAPQGTALSTTLDAAQGNLIIPVPGTKNQFYNFTVDAVTSTCCSSCQWGSNRGSRYRIITATGGGNISISAEMTTGTLAADTNTAECQVGIPKSNGKDYWWITHNRGSNQFNVYSVTNAGVTLSNTYSLGYSFTNCSYTSLLQVNTCYNQIALTVDGTVSIFTFDNVAGGITNAQQWTLADAYGVEYSTNNKYLYVSQGVSGGNPQNIYQYDVSSGVAATIAATGVSLGSTYGGLGKSGHLQLAPDGNIYVAQMSSYSAANYPQYIGAITNINYSATGAAPNATFNQKYISINDPSNKQAVTMGLPTILKSLLVQSPPAIVNDTLTKSGDTITVCQGNKFYLTYQFGGNTTSVLWKFGDGSTSTLMPTTNHIYASTGFYTVTLIITDNCGRKDSVVNYVKVPANTTAGSISCGGSNKLTLTGTGPGKANYIWYSAASGGTVLGTGASVTIGPYTPFSTAPSSVWVTDATGQNTYAALSTHKPSQQISTGSKLTSFTTSKALTLVSVQAAPWNNSCTAGTTDSVYFTITQGATGTGALVGTTQNFPVTCAQSNGGTMTFAININIPTPGTYSISYTMKTSVFTNYFQDDFYSATTSTSSSAASIGVGTLANLYGSGPDSGPFFNFVFMDYNACAPRLQITQTCSLPVNLLYLKATPNGSENLIEWATATEFDNSYFIVERSKDGITFTSIAQIPGVGTTNQIQYYDYADGATQRGVVYYRLVQVDINGVTHPSNVVSLNRDGSSLVQLAPNPFSDQTNLSFFSDVTASIRIMDLVGKTICTYTKPAQQGEISIGAGLSKGAYIVQVITELEENNYKIIKE
jgi:hypothetical protein